MRRRRFVTPPTDGSGGGGGTQSAVSLTAIDGESISGGVQSNFAGNGFWTRNGLTKATSWTASNPLGGTFAGFDDPSFLPIGVWLGQNDSTQRTRLTDLGVNGFLPISGPQSNALELSNGGFWAVVTWEEPWTTNVWPPGTVSSSIDAYVVGSSVGEEPATVALFEAIRDHQATWLSDASDGPGRFGLYNFADPILNGDQEGVYFQHDMATALPSVGEVQITACDQYWIAGAPEGTSGGQNRKFYSRLYTGPGEPGIGATTDVARRGCHYGSMLDCIRKVLSTSERHPMVMWIENGAPYTETTSTEIAPAEMKWAVWSTLVHGARAIGYFNHTFRTGDPGSGSNNFGNNYYGGPGVAGNGIYAAAKEVNRRALALAPVINSPFDGYFCYGDGYVGGETMSGGGVTTGAISTPGFLTAVTSTNTRTRASGVDACCKWYPTDGKHYILSTTRESGAATSIPVTFRMVDQGQTSAVEVHAGTTLSITRGGSIPGGFCEFSDTFATAATYKTYRID